MVTGEATGGKFDERAGALTLFRVANPSEPQPQLPEEELEFLVPLLERWLGACPSGSLSLGPDAAPALEALLGGWCTTVVHALAARPLTIAATAELVEGLSEAEAAERIGAMAAVGLLDTLPGRRSEDRYAAGEWLRTAIGPLAAAARIEARHLAHETTPIAPLDVEAAFLLTLELIALPEEISASCRLTVPIPGRPPRLAGVAVLIERGTITEVSPNLLMDSGNFATGGPLEWIDTLVDPAVASLKSGGDPEVTLGLLQGLHERLFGVAVA